MEKNITWNDWLSANKEVSTLSYINQPSWIGYTKGGNPYNFNDVQLTGIDINRAFAEGINMQNAVLKDVNFEEGDFSRANFNNSTFINCKFNKTILTDANFNDVTFHNCNLNRVNLTNANFCVKEIKETVVYGISAWDLKTSENSIQSKLVLEKTYKLYSDIIAEGRIPLMVDNIELAQFIYYLSNHKKLRDTINVLNKRGVLLLGKFSDGGLERLYKLRNWFSDRNYLPIIFDFDRPSSLDYTETIVTLSGLSKFVVADLSGNSVPQELHAILTNFMKPVIVYHDKVAYSMLKDLKRKNKYFHDIEFDGTEENLLSQLPLKLKEAEKDFRDIIMDLAKEYDQ